MMQPFPSTPLNDTMSADNEADKEATLLDFDARPGLHFSLEEKMPPTHDNAAWNRTSLRMKTARGGSQPPAGALFSPPARIPRAWGGLPWPNFVSFIGDLFLTSSAAADIQQRTPKI